MYDGGVYVFMCLLALVFREIYGFSCVESFKHISFLHINVHALQEQTKLQLFVGQSYMNWITLCCTTMENMKKWTIVVVVIINWKHNFLRFSLHWKPLMDVSYERTFVISSMDVHFHRWKFTIVRWKWFVSGLLLKFFLFILYNFLEMFPWQRIFW